MASVCPKGNTGGMGTASDYLRLAHKFARFFEGNRLTLEEYTSNLIAQSASYAPADLETARAIAESVPSLAREMLLKEIAAALAPDFHYPPCEIGGPQLAAIYTEHIRDWASALDAAFREKISS